MGFADNNTWDCTLERWQTNWPKDYANSELAGKPAKSVWHLRTQADMADLNESAALAARLLREAQRKAESEGREFNGDDQRLVAGHCFLATMSDGWFGPEFLLPKNYRDRSKPRGDDGLYPIHELAGTVPPCTLDWIVHQKPQDVIELTQELNTFTAARSPEDEKTFQDGVVGVEQSEGAEIDAPSLGQGTPDDGGPVSEAGEPGEDSPDGTDAVDGAGVPKSKG